MKRTYEGFREESAQEINKADYYKWQTNSIYWSDLYKITDKKYYAYVERFVKEYREEEMKRHGYTFDDGVLDQLSLTFMCRDGHKVYFEH